MFWQWQLVTSFEAKPFHFHSAQATVNESKNRSVNLLPGLLFVCYYVWSTLKLYIFSCSRDFWLLFVRHVSLVGLLYRFLLNFIRFVTCTWDETFQMFVIDAFLSYNDWICVNDWLVDASFIHIFTTATFTFYSTSVLGSCLMFVRGQLPKR